MPKKGNYSGFTDMQLETVLRFCKKTVQDPKITYSNFHRRFGTYNRRCTTSNAICKAYEKKVIFGPTLFCNNNIEVELMKTEESPLRLFRRKKKDPTTTLCMALCGDWSFVLFRRGANILEYFNSILPNSLSNVKIEQLEFREKGKLERIEYPHGWDEIDWSVYHLFRKPRQVSFFLASKELNMSWKSVQQHYEKILKQCKTYMSFFPLGHEGYSYFLATFRTDFEIGVENALKRLDRTSFLYKARGTIILLLFTSPDPLAYNRVSERFEEMEEIGIIHDLRVCIPIRWHDIF